MTFGNGKKSHEAKYGVYGDYRRTIIIFKWGALSRKIGVSFSVVMIEDQFAGDLMPNVEEHFPLLLQYI